MRTARRSPRQRRLWGIAAVVCGLLVGAGDLFAQSAWHAGHGAGMMVAAGPRFPNLPANFSRQVTSPHFPNLPANFAHQVARPPHQTRMPPRYPYPPRAMAYPAMWHHGPRGYYPPRPMMPAYPQMPRTSWYPPPQPMPMPNRPMIPVRAEGSSTIMPPPAMMSLPPAPANTPQQGPPPTSHVVHSPPSMPMALPATPVHVVPSSTESIDNWWYQWMGRFQEYRSSGRGQFMDKVYQQANGPIWDPFVEVETTGLLYQSKPQRLSIPILSTGSSADPSPGGLGQPGTRVLVGNESIEYGPFIGGRIRFGKWFSQEGKVGMSLGLTVLEERTHSVMAGSDATGSPTLAFPIFRPDLGREGVFLISDPGRTLFGTVAIDTSSQFWGYEGLATIKMTRTPYRSVDFLIGFRHMQLEEGVHIEGDLFDPVLGVADRFNDDFDTDNQFYGGLIGCRLEQHLGMWHFGARATVSLGNNHEVVNINGRSRQTLVGARTSEFAGGVFTQPSNIGLHSGNSFVWVPEVQLKCGVDLLPAIRLFAGYDFLYWNQTVRPGDQIDHAVNRTQRVGGTLVGPARPAAEIRDSEYWIHGINFGFLWLF